LAKLGEHLAAELQERFASTWLLLSDTTNFLSRTSVFLQYESTLMEMRRLLSSSSKNSDTERSVRRDLTELRKALRVQGYDLSLGKLELTLQGFRNDSSVAEGFNRIVLFIGKREIWYLVGEDNHIELNRRLEQYLGEKAGEILQKHYLWYRWNHEQLIISGSDTESKDDFETFKAWCSQPERRLHLLAQLKRLR
jgi:hypothetical protein